MGELHSIHGEGGLRRQRPELPSGGLTISVIDVFSSIDGRLEHGDLVVALIEREVPGCLLSRLSSSRGGLGRVVALEKVYASLVDSGHVPDVLNISLSHMKRSRIEEECLESLSSIGCSVIAAAGSRGSMPGALPFVTSVGRCDHVWADVRVDASISVNGRRLTGASASTAFISALTLSGKIKKRPDHLWPGHTEGGPGSSSVKKRPA